MTTTTSPLVDIGANLAHDSFDADFDEVLERAREAGLVAMLVTGSSVASSRRSLELAGEHDWLYPTAGIHPHIAGDCDDSTLEAIGALVAEPAVRAVGETGLDFNRDFSPRADQEKVFVRHLELAAESGKPVFLHQRDAHDRFLPILREYRDALSGGVVHCFTDEARALHDYLDLDMHIGITGWVCDERRGRHLHEMLPSIPADRLLLETDAPYLLPRSLRPRPKSRRNEPCYLPEVLRSVAQCRDTREEELARQTTDNAARLFNLGTF